MDAKISVFVICVQAIIFVIIICMTMPLRTWYIFFFEFNNMYGLEFVKAFQFL